MSGVLNMIVLLTLLWMFSLDTSQCVSFRYTNISCLNIYKLGRTDKDKLTCTGENVVNHCIPDDQQREAEVCVQWKWMSPGYCPYYDKIAAVIKEERCSFYCLRKNDLHNICTCPPRFSDDSCQKKCGTEFGSDKYIFCEAEKVSTTISPTKNVTSGRHDLRKSSESHVNLSTKPSTTSGSHDTKNSSESQFDGGAVAIAIGVIMPLILLVVVGILLFKKRRHTEDKGEKAVEIGEDKALVSTETKYLEEKSEKQQRGNEEGTHTQIKVTEGIFVDSLDSITKQDGEEEGSSELQELLDYMCTGPARKILFNVVKMYVKKNPDSYFQEESKMASVRALLPSEYHSALDYESESRNSIPVCYAILQLSLSAVHQPKSGWGQEVKNIDIGVGDDVERVYRVHMLSREIYTPQRISVDGYVRLFEMLFGAVERLDIRGKCSEDYKEIVRRWENIQRKQWVKDKWKTFTKFMQKWSQ